MNVEDFDADLAMLKQFDTAYFNDEPLIPDVQYDRLKERLVAANPDHPYFTKVGSPVRGGKIDLPYPMGSLNQIYAGDYEKWVTRHNLSAKDLIITHKLDGMSVLLVYNTNKLAGNVPLSIAYSRGDGLRGADIFRHIKKIPSVPLLINGKNMPNSPVFSNLAVRAEVIMPEKTFQDKFSKAGKNSRNFVSGCMNRKETDQNILDHIHVVAYELVDLDGNLVENFENEVGEFTKENTLKFLEDAGFSVVKSEKHAATTLNDDKLAEIFTNITDTSDYLVDGVVVTVNDYAKLQKVTKSDSLNPEHSVKFKTLSDDAIVEATVVDVHWKISKSGFYKPRVEIVPVELFGTTVTFATGFNGKFICDNKIGPGTTIKITKAGSVIPYIVEVVSSTQAALPESTSWCYNNAGVEIMALGKGAETDFMQAVHFFSTLGVENLKETSLRKVVDKYAKNKSFVDIVKTLFDLLDVEWERVLGQNGIKIYSSLHKNLRNLAPAQLLGACPFFGQGFGVRKAKKIMTEMSLEEFLSSSPEKISSIEGFDKTSVTICEGIPDFKSFLGAIANYTVLNDDVNKVDTTSQLHGNVIVFTGFRDKDLQKEVEAKGARVSSAVSGKTTLVVAADKNSNSGKISKAKQLNIEVLSKDEFIDLYM